MIPKQQLIGLLTGHLRDDLTDQDQEQLNNWIDASERNRLLFESIDDEEQLRSLVLLYFQEKTENNEELILQKIRTGMSTLPAITPVRKMPSLWKWVAAVAVVTAGIGFYFLDIRENKKEGTLAGNSAEILPGKEGAILTLADGTKMVLDTLGNGVIASENGTQVLLQNGSLSYAQNATEGEAVTNVLSTPKGRQFRLVLPDGTKVWMNAASSLRYPTIFSGNKRQVRVTGEVFFEVAPNHLQPFLVDIDNKAQVEVLGTQFNVNAYSNEKNIRTTLVDGSIRIRAGAGYDTSSFKVMKPGEQAQSSLSEQANLQGVKVVNNVNIEKVIAWKKGLFNFEDASLEEVLRQIERWYDIEVVYEKGIIPDIIFGGKFSNDVSLEGMLRSLKESEVNFRMEGRKLIVLP
ncbi:MAG: FecR family protein [Pseudobacter sp.]|uniref:FecR family protein n=1 Tax=Pseudobacter sp. TaxID=2045420 RepID=UPI003F7E4AD1